MALFVDIKYVNLVSPRLERFTHREQYVWNFRCPICGDSRKNKSKARGYFLRKKFGIYYMCHNCSASMSLGNFLKHMDNSLYKQYRMDTYKEQNHANVPRPDLPMIPKPTIKTPVVKSLPLESISELDDDNIARQYVMSRKIPKKFWHDLYYAENFRDFADKFFVGHDKKILDEPRLVIPFYNQEGILQGIQGRVLMEAKVRYITMKVCGDASKLFGLDRVDLTKQILVVEGPIDSLFLPNCIATMDSSLIGVKKSLGERDYLFVPDNEPRNPEIIREIKKIVKAGNKVCIWPESVKEKDINDMIKSGLTEKQITNIIEENTVEGLAAELKFQQWSKT